MAELKPCPKCNGEDIWPEVGEPGPFGMICLTCGFVGPRVSIVDPDEAMDAWDDLPRPANALFARER